MGKRSEITEIFEFEIIGKENQLRKDKGPWMEGNSFMLGTVEKSEPDNEGKQNRKSSFQNTEYSTFWELKKILYDK